MHLKSIQIWIITACLWYFWEDRYPNGPTSGLIWHMSHLISLFLAWVISANIFLFNIEDLIHQNGVEFNHQFSSAFPTSVPDILAGCLKMTACCDFQRACKDVQDSSDWLRGGHLIKQKQKNGQMTVYSCISLKMIPLLSKLGE